MSVYSLTTASEKAIGMLLTAGGGSETLLLRRPANELRAELHLEPAGRTLTAVILLGHQRNTLTLQDGDGANQLNLADYIEAIANGTADTAETGTIGAPAELEVAPRWQRDRQRHRLVTARDRPAPGVDFPPLGLPRGEAAALGGFYT